MAEFYNPSSRLGRKRIRQAYWHIFLALTISILLISAIIYLGIPGIVKLSGLLGNFKSSFEPINTSDTTPPFPPRLEPISEATNSASVVVKGFSEPDSTVELFLNGETAKKLIIGNEGSFKTEVILKEGENRILAQATDNAENVSHPSKTIFITYRKKGPKLTISQPEEGADFSGDERTIEIQGITDPSSMVTINDRYAIVNQDGSFSYSISLADGDNLLKITATDRAGNETIVERKVKYSP